MTYNIKNKGIAAIFGLAVGFAFTPALAQESAECDLNKPLKDFTEQDKDACQDNEEFAEISKLFKPEENSYDNDFSIRLHGKITEKTSRAVIDNLLEASRKDPDQEITMRINSPRGSLVHALAIYDVMQAIPNEVSTICEGQAASAAFMLLSTGADGKRTAYPHCSLMAHQASGGAVGQIEDAKISMEQFDEFNQKMLQVIQDHSGWSIDTLKGMTSHNLYLSPEEAVSLGFIDTVIEVKPLPEIEIRDSSNLPDEFCDNTARENLRICYEM